ncbi:putative membrane protein [Halobacteriovorax sp. BALOs_7]|uniref:hypothetical protein n=1 Tax=Halobacteriovorax sp. BALOs_7 TaxID=2109558 RepID=UPI000EA0A80D|nr:hypothetical protein [Halobacteriovorax sp. BALOs_7]AYF45732.1 putative membrane protein [Halobacteriovorax sp. BALOs_7]
MIRSKDKTIVKEYEFGLTTGNLIIALVIFGGVTLLLGYITITQPDWIKGLLTLLSFGFCIALYLNNRFKRKIVVYDDSILLPIGLWSHKSKLIKLEDLEDDIESNVNGIPLIHFKIRGEKKAITIQQTHMDEVEFFELQEWLLSKLKSRTYVDDKLTKGKPKAMAKVWTGVAILFMPLMIFISQYVSGNLEEAEDYLRFCGLIIVLFLIIYLSSKVQQKHLEEKKQVVKKLAAPENRKKRNIWASVIYGLGGISFIGAMFVLRTTSTDGIMTLLPFVYYSLLLTVCCVYTLHLCLPKVEEIIGKTGMYVGYTFTGMFMFMTLIFVLGHLNIKLDSSTGVERISTLAGEFTNRKGRAKTCFHLAHWETGEEFKEGSFCNDKYPRLKEDDEVSYISYNGYFDIPWVSDIKFLRYETPINYLRSLDDFSKLRYFDVKMLINLKGNDFWKSQSLVWDSECSSNNWDSCRFMGYLSSSKENKQSAMGYFRRGCDNQDFYNCYNAFLMDRGNPDTKEYALRNTKKLCSNTESKELKTLCEYMAK